MFIQIHLNDFQNWSCQSLAIGLLLLTMVCRIVSCFSWLKKAQFLWRSVAVLLCSLLLAMIGIPTVAFAQTVPSTPEITNLALTPNQLTVAAVNVENLDPSDSQSRFERLGRLIVTNLSGPDIIALSEVQDNDGRTNSDVTEADLTYSRLVEAIIDAGGTNYSAIDVAPLDDTNGGQPGGNIRVGFLFNPARVSLVPGTPGNATTAVQVTDTAVPTLTLNPGSIDPNNPAFDNSRKPLAAEFNFNGESVFVIANHFASKRGGREADLQRVRQAQAVHNFVAEILEDDADAKVIVAGDLNDFADSPALKVVAGDELQNLIELLPHDDRFTFEFRGNLQVLDHILVSQSLLFDADAEFDIVHANIRQSNAASDHDPVLARFALAPAAPVVPLPPISLVPPVSSTILPELTGEALEGQLAADFAIVNPLDYGRARDFMYGQIDNDNGTVLTLYANFSAQIPADVNTARATAGAVGVNAEHSWPQSRGTRQGRARSDLHHLFPTLERLNSIRGNKPFADIPDSQTDIWFFEERELEFPPPEDIINNFTESDLPAWEPREAIKGDLARAQFYVASIYRDQVDRGFFEGQQQTLCQWHAADPVDRKEMTRNASIKALQGNDNPFILDPSLADRLYCP